MAFTESTGVVVPDISIHVEHGQTTENKKRTFRQAQGVRRHNRLIHVGFFWKIVMMSYYRITRCARKTASSPSFTTLTPLARWLMLSIYPRHKSSPPESWAPDARSW